MKIGVFTIASKNYLAYARTLLASVASQHPEYRRYLCLVDKVDGYFDPLKEEFELVEAEQLGVDTLWDMSIRYDVMELNTAVKPFMIRWLLENFDLDAVIYLDPDIQVYSRFDVLEAELRKGASVVLTPHITAPVEDGLNPNDYHMLQAGVFNLGFIAIRRCEEALKFIQWWGRRLKTACAADFSINLFTDQRWCDLAPCFLDRLVILKHPGYNVAYWNLFQRSVVLDESGCWTSNEDPLVFFHFSGVNVDHGDQISKHQNRLNWHDVPLCHALFRDYRTALVSSGWHVCKLWPYAYAHFGEGLEIAPVMRKLFRQKVPQSVDFLDFEAACDYLLHVCNNLSEDIVEHETAAITDLMLLVYRSRPDLNNVFDLLSSNGRMAFASWFEVSGLREYNLSSEFSVQESIRGLGESRHSKKKPYSWR